MFSFVVRRSFVSTRSFSLLKFKIHCYFQIFKTHCLSGKSLKILKYVNNGVNSQVN